MSITGPIVNYFYSPVVRPAVERPLSLLANFVREQYRINGGGVLFDTAFDITRSSSKYVYGTGAQTGQLVEVPPNEPAYDHDPITGAPLGLSVEGSATNLLTYSEQFDDAAWVKVECTVSPNVAVAPDGQLTADKIIPSTNNVSNHLVRQFVSLTANKHTLPVFAKADGYQWIAVAHVDGDGSSYLAYFDVLNGVKGAVVGSATSEIEVAGQGFFRCSVTPNSAAAAASSQNQFIYVVDRDGGGAFAGDGTSGVYIWGAQLETGTKPTSYIPTLGTTLTRDADIVTSDAATFGDWFSSSEGTFVVEWESSSNDLAWVINKGDTGSNAFGIFNSVNNSRVELWKGNDISNRLLLPFSSFGGGVGVRTRTVITSDATGSVLACNGVSVTDALPVNWAALTDLLFGSDSVGSRSLKGTMKIVSFEPNAITQQSAEKRSTL